MSTPQRLQTFWNPELGVYIVIELVVAIICVAFNPVNSFNFLEVTKWTSAAYLVSRGIAKAGRVMEENRSPRA
jgi:hypothetical protein